MKKQLITSVVALFLMATVVVFATGNMTMRDIATGIQLISVCILGVILQVEHNKQWKGHCNE